MVRGAEAFSGALCLPQDSRRVRIPDFNVRGGRRGRRLTWILQATSTGYLYVEGIPKWQCCMKRLP